MDAGENLVNANPTILNPADLPSRRRDAPAAAHRRRLFDTLATPAYPSPIDNSIDADSDADSEDALEAIDEQEVYDLIAPISDPEHPLSLGSLGVVVLDDISIHPSLSSSPSSAAARIATVRVLLTPTTSACSLTTVIGLGVKVRLLQALPPRFRVDVRIKPGTSRTADEVNKQLADKERVAAAMENRSLLGVVAQMLSTCE